MNWKTSNKRPLVISHRGDRKAGPENTLPAFDAALRSGVDGIEMDIRRTQDGILVVFHDEDLKRMVRMPDVVERTSFAALRQIPLARTYIPRLEEVLELVRNRALLNLEIKTSPLLFSDVEKNMAKLLAKFRLNDTVLVSSFHPQSLVRMRMAAPHIFRGHLFQDKYPFHRLIFPATAPFSLNAPVTAATKEFVRETHAAGRRFFAWTANREGDMKRCIESGVDGIITDEPEKLKSLLKNLSR